MTRHKKLALLGLLFSVSGLTGAEGWQTRLLVPGSVIQAIEGIDVGPDGMVYGTSIHAQAVYRIDPDTGLVTVAVASPYGESDDVAAGPAGSPFEGMLAWTAQRTGQIRIQHPGGMPIVLMDDAPRVNPIAFSPEGRLFTAQVGAGENALWELDPTGEKPPRLVAKNEGALNGFGFGPDGYLYAPHFGSSGIFRIDVDTGDFELLVDDVGTIAASKVDKDGDVWSVDYQTGDLYRTDPTTGIAKIEATLPPPIDNLVFGDDGTLYLASLADSGLIAYDPDTKDWHFVTQGAFTVPLGLAMTIFHGRPALLAADPFGFRFIDPDTGDITRPPEMWSVGASTAVAANDRIIVTAQAEYGRVRVIERGTSEILVTTSAVTGPRGLAVTSTGDVVVADANTGRLVRLVGEDVELIADGLGEPVGLFLEADGSALVTDVASGSIIRVDLETGSSTVVAEGLDDPRAIALLPDGRAVVPEPAGGRVIAIDLENGGRTVLAEGLPISADKMHLPNNTPLGIAVDVDGAIFVSCAGDNSIMKLTRQ